MDKTVRAVTWVLAGLPAASLALFGAFIVRARVELGRWPLVSSPDPKDLGFDIHYWLWFWSLFGQFLAAPLLFVTLLAGWYRWPESRQQLALASVVYVVLPLISVALYRGDPGGFSEWTGD